MKILVVDDHPLIRQGLRQTLDAEADLTVAGEAGNAKDALAQLRSGMFDLLILDINLPDRSGLDLLQEIRNLCSRLPILVLSIHREHSLGRRALKAGANGYLCKDSAPEELVRAVRQVSNGGSYVSAELTDMLVAELSGRPNDSPHGKLSDREYQVMCLLATGKTITQIASLLRLGPTTISTYRMRILEKMELTSNAELARYAVINQLVS